MIAAELPASVKRIDGFILRKTAIDIGVESVRTVWVYADLTSEQMEKAGQAPRALGFDSEWLETHREPDAYSQPLALTILCLTIAALGGVILATYAAATTRSLRPRVAALLALGLPTTWLASVVAFEVGVIAITAVIGAAMAGVISASMAVALGAFTFDLHVPGFAVGGTIASILIIAALAMFWSGRRLSVTERFD
jgi:predicted lysophospholipase L1 biosynthesis ABC-type transport system permease subunit